MELQMIMVLARALILVINTIIGGMCIYLGWRLYFETIRMDSKIEFNSGAIKLIIQSAAPGLFFVGFGIFLLIYVLQQKVEIQLNDKYLNNNSSAIVFGENKSINNKILNVAHSGNIKEDCLFNEKKMSIKWADESDPSSNRQKIIKTLDYSIQILTEEAKSNQGNMEMSGNIHALKEIKNGFESEKNY